MSDRDRIVYKRGPHEWVDKRLDAGRARVHTTQEEAEAAARATLKSTGGGELITKGLDGRINSKDTIHPGNESAVRDREH